MNGLLDFWSAWGGTLIGTVLAVLGLLFVVRFMLPAIFLDRELRRAIRALEALLRAEGGAAERPARCGEILASPGLRHLWREYAQTLHRHDSPGATPDAAPAARATAMAGLYFTEQAVVDTPLQTGFYKHLPGILTGVGIIGTFSGLIAGLGHFQVSSEASAVRGSLEMLIRSVGHAFEVSAAAITLAMLFTWIEKSLTTRLYRAVERLTQAVDSLFDAGVGEDYLARLVRASEASAAQGAQLRQVLATELRQGLQGVLAEQQAAARLQQDALAERLVETVGRSLQQTLGEPMARMSLALEQLGKQQGAALGQTMNDILQRFSQHLEQTLGQRHGDIDGLLGRTTQTLEQIVSELGQLSQRLEQSGKGAITTASGQLQRAGGDMQRVGESLAGLGEEMAAAARAMNGAAQTASEAMREQARLQDSIARMVGDLRATVEVARRDAAMSGELVRRLEQSASLLGVAQVRADEYLQSVNQVLTEAHGAFATNIEQTLGRGNSQFQKAVVTAVEALEGAIEELSDALNGERSLR